jgi:hypothetical protein
MREMFGMPAGGCGRGRLPAVREGELPGVWGTRFACPENPGVAAPSQSPSYGRTDRQLTQPLWMDSTEFVDRPKGSSEIWFAASTSSRNAVKGMQDVPPAIRLGWLARAVFFWVPSLTRSGENPTSP